MRPMSMLSIFMALMAFPALIAKTAIAQTTPSERGQAIAERHCARCHAIGPAGHSPMGLAPPFRDLSQRYPIETLAEALAEGIMTGHPAMPHFAFHPREIDALLTYIDGLTPLREPRTRKR
jgi:cytochrome c